MKQQPLFPNAYQGLYPNLHKAMLERKEAIRKIQNPTPPKPKAENTAKTILIYSGKGGVGKTTTTANIARTLLEQGKKVAIIDGDVNTPSMAVLFPTSKSENLLVCSMGYTPAVFVQSSKVRAFFQKAVRDVLAFKPEYLLIDTPPSITDTHIGLVESLKPSGLLLVTQPTELSWSDVARTVWFFESKNLPILGVVRSMVTPESQDFPIPYPILANITFDHSFDGVKVWEANRGEYEKLALEVDKVAETVIENRKRILFDETKVDIDLLLKDKKNLRFMNLSTWTQVREALIDFQDEFDRLVRGMGHDQFLYECTPERVNRMVKAFEYDDEAYFMVTRTPNTDVRLIVGEIGQCRLKQHKTYYNIPVVEYHTSNGPVTLFPYEVMPATEEMIRDSTNHGGIVLKDGRYLPSKQTVEECYYAYGSRVGLNENWEQDYGFWTNN